VKIVVIGNPHNTEQDRKKYQCWPESQERLSYRTADMGNGRKESEWLG
jgi:hypothetical protein